LEAEDLTGGRDVSNVTEEEIDHSALGMLSKEERQTIQRRLHVKGSWEYPHEAGQHVFVHDSVWIGTQCKGTYCGKPLRGLKRSPFLGYTEAGPFGATPQARQYCSIECVEEYAAKELEDAKKILAREAEREIHFEMDPAALAISMCPPERRIDTVAAGELHTAFVSHAGGVFTFGNGEYGRLGHGDTEPRTLPTKVQALNGVFIKKLETGLRHIICSSKEGFVYTWGAGRYGRLGHGDEFDQHEPKKIKGVKEIRFVGAGEVHSLMIDKHGQAYTFGCGTDGRLGHNNTDDQLLPKRVEQWTAVGRKGSQKVKCVQAALGTAHSVVRTNLGQIFTCGLGAHGQLGHGGRLSLLEFTRVDGLLQETDFPVINIASGDHFTLLLVDASKEEGRAHEVWSTGYGKEGQLGHGEIDNVYGPTPVEALKGVPVTDMSAGTTHSAFVTSVGECYSCGEGMEGQLGQGRILKRQLTPVPVKGLEGQVVRQIVCGQRHTLARTAQGRLFSWGKGGCGQLGIKNAYQKHVWTPEQLPEHDVPEQTQPTWTTEANVLAQTRQILGRGESALVKTVVTTHAPKNKKKGKKSEKKKPSALVKLRVS
jgi:alpha-tubulin suppressor-like RCC1 family protein